MGRTNIHRAQSLLNRAGTSFEEVAFIPDAERLVYIISGALTQDHLDRYADVLRNNRAGSWIQKDEGPPWKFAYSQGDQRLSIPKINVSNGMQVPGKEGPRYVGFRKAPDEYPEEHGPEEIELAYILVIQGQTGDTRCKLVVETSLERASSAIMHEALNGYSTVFTAAMLKANLAKLQDEAYALNVVEDRKTLKVIDSDPTSKCIGFWC
ncbi:hypothetical protein H2201_009056 [Coniosporium apollinis]|uniref:Uncharacterized protein n=2 Tax=Coniosporium TaxID=2810619 RepID=A0ABQ9NH57_9PEZI|nr:hypothetical protein H2199_009111 [Cladosporium sp. JES 115]KAJ9654009.1 hypothetical protein H2201_009056 [Coniosporium apollinis]